MTASWRFVTNHAAVLIEVALDPDARIRDIANRLALTERTVQGLLKDLTDAGYMTREKVGNRYRYTCNPDAKLRHSRLRNITIGSLLSALSHGEPVPRRDP